MERPHRTLVGELLRWITMKEAVVAAEAGVSPAPIVVGPSSFLGVAAVKGGDHRCQRCVVKRGVVCEQHLLAPPTHRHFRERCPREQELRVVVVVQLIDRLPRRNDEAVIHRQKHEHAKHDWRQPFHKPESTQLGTAGPVLLPLPLGEGWGEGWPPLSCPLNPPKVRDDASRPLWGIRPFA